MPYVDANSKLVKSETNRLGSSKIGVLSEQFLAKSRKDKLFKLYYSLPVRLVYNETRGVNRFFENCLENELIPPNSLFFFDTLT